MVKGRRTGATAAAILVLAGLALSGCGDADNGARSGSSPAPSSTAQTSPKTSAQTSPGSSPATSTAPTVAGGLSVARPGRLLVVPADRLATRCPTRQPAGGDGVVCQGRSAVYRFQPPALRVVAAVRAEAMAAQDDRWAVEIDLDGPSGRRLAAVTRDAARAHEYVVVMPTGHGPVIAAAQVMAPITGGQLQIAGLKSRLVAQRIVNRITKTAR